MEIDFQSTNRFLMSLGFAVCTISIVPAYMLFYGYNSENTTILLTTFLTFVLLIIGLCFINKGYSELKKSEDEEKKMKFEFMVNQILDQDLKFINLKIKELEYNEKVMLLKKDNSTSLFIKDLNEKKLREIPDVVYQALNPNFYEETYPNRGINVNKPEDNKKRTRR